MTKERLGDCPERVALDLAIRIESDTRPVGGTTDRDEAYWTGLYYRCWAVVQGREPKPVPPKK